MNISQIFSNLHRFVFNLQIFEIVNTVLNIYFSTVYSNFQQIFLKYFKYCLKVCRIYLKYLSNFKYNYINLVTIIAKSD